MKLLEIDETEAQLVIKQAGSKVAHVAKKDDAEDVHRTLLEVLAEAPEQKPQDESGPEPEDIPEDLESEVKDVLDTFLKAGEAIVNSEQGKRARSLLERLPRSKRFRKNG